MGAHMGDRFPCPKSDDVDVLELWLSVQRYRQRKPTREEVLENYSWLFEAEFEAHNAMNKIIYFPAPLPVTVLAMERYLKDGMKMIPSRGFRPGSPASPSQPSTRNPFDFELFEVTDAPSSVLNAHLPPSVKYVYDVIISDGKNKNILFLAPKLNHLVHKNILRCGVQVKIKRLSCFISEKHFFWFMCIEEVEIVGEADPSEVARLLALRYPAPKEHVPLTGRWMHFLPIWHNKDPYGDIWQGKKAEQKADVLESLVDTLASLKRHFSKTISNEVTSSKYPVIVKIIKKRAIEYYGKPNLDVENPYKATFIVADRSGSMVMVLCDNLCLEWYHSFEVGTVLHLDFYGVKKNRHYKAQRALRLTGVKKLQPLEMILNDQLTCSDISIVPEMDVKTKWELPKITYRFLARSTLPNIPFRNQYCDVVGLVKFVGRVQRTRETARGIDFLIFRWLMVADGTSNQPFLLQLFCTSQPDVFWKIQPTMYIVCTNMKLMYEIGGGDFSGFYLKTTDESQVFTTEWRKNQLNKKIAKVKYVAKWMKTHVGRPQLQDTFMGGYYPLPPAPKTSAMSFKATLAFPMLNNLKEVQRAIGRLHYREYTRIYFYGRIGAIKYVNCTKILPETSVKKPEEVSQEAAAGTFEQTLQSLLQKPAAGTFEQALQSLLQKPAAGTFGKALQSLLQKSAAGTFRQTLKSLLEEPEAGTSGQTSQSLLQKPAAGTSGQTSQSLLQKPVAGTSGQSLQSLLQKPAAGTFGQTSQSLLQKPVAGTSGQTSQSLLQKPVAGTSGQSLQSLLQKPAAGTFGQTSQSLLQKPVAGTSGQSLQSLLQKPAAGTFGQTSQSLLEEPAAGTSGQTLQSLLQKPAAGTFGQTSQSLLQEPAAGTSGQTSQSLLQKPAAGTFGQNLQSLLQEPAAGTSGQTSQSLLQKPAAGTFGQNLQSLLQEPAAGTSGQTSQSLLQKPAAGTSGQSLQSLLQEPAAGTSGQTSQSSEPRKCLRKRKHIIEISDEDEEDVAKGIPQLPRKRFAKMIYVEPAEPSTVYWESELWKSIKGKVRRHMHYSKVYDESFPCKFNYENAEYLMHLSNLQENKWKYVPAVETESIYPREYYELTLIGADYNSAIDVALLPVNYAANSELVLSNDLQYETHSNPSSSHRNPMAAEFTREMLSSDLLVCILDVCSLGDNKVEVFLNKVFKPDENAFRNSTE